MTLVSTTINGDLHFFVKFSVVKLVKNLHNIVDIKKLVLQKK